jgi:hypothetical protein
MVLKSAAFCVAWLCLAGLEAPLQAQAGDGFRVTDPIVCKTIKGLGQYERLDPPELTVYDKLLIYVEPTGFATKSADGVAKGLLVQNGKVRAKGSKTVIFERQELLKVEPEIKVGRELFYLSATVGFKNLKPGPYTLELETVDKQASPERKVTQVIDFQIITGEAPADEEKPKPAPSRKKKR